MTVFTVMDHPVPKFSKNVIDIKEQSKQLDRIISSAATMLTDADKLNLENIFSLYEPRRWMAPVHKPEPVKKKVTIAKKVAPKKVVRKKVSKLPKVAGIFHVLDKNGNDSSLALIDGQYRRQNETIRGYRIKEISPKGVIVDKNGTSLFLPAPKGLFSVTHTDGS